MDTEKYKILLTVIEKGSISAAADELGYTPSGVSRSVAALESELGFQLLYRGKKGARPTGACEGLIPSARELIKAERRLSQTAAAITGVVSGSIVIGTAYSYYYKWLTEMTSQFHELHKGVDFKIINGTSTELAEKLDEHRADICIISRRGDNRRWIPLLNDELVAMLPPSHRFAEAERVPVEIFAEESYINTYPGQDIDNARVFAKCGIRPNTQFATMDIYATYSMVEAGLGISMNNNINSGIYNGNVIHVPLDPPQFAEIGVACAADPMPAAEAFVEYIRLDLSNTNNTLLLQKGAARTD